MSEPHVLSLFVIGNHVYGRPAAFVVSLDISTKEMVFSTKSLIAALIDLYRLKIPSLDNKTYTMGKYVKLQTKSYATIKLVKNCTEDRAQGVRV